MLAPMTPSPPELEVLIDQLDELLAQDATHPIDAVEIATVAGLAARLGARSEVLAAAEDWRAGPGGPLLDEAFQHANSALDDLVEQIDAASEGGAEEEVVDEAITDFDDLVAAAAWSGHTKAVRDAARHVADIVRTLPDVFAFLAPDARTMARTPAVAADPDLYDYWFALVDAGEWALDDE